MDLEKGMIIKVRWVNALLVNKVGVIDSPEKLMLPIHHCIGYFISQDKECIKIGVNLREYDWNFSSIQLIPNELIKKIDVLKDE